jgi:hypothetical protein
MNPATLSGALRHRRGQPASACDGNRQHPEERMAAGICANNILILLRIFKAIERF